MYGIIQNEGFKHLESCITDVQNLESMVTVCISDFESGDLTKYIQGVQEIIMVV